ncbi:hypothetical protein PMAYCL1PPCAC_28297, partial [Pristionchus mayeri]
LHRCLYDSLHLLDEGVITNVIQGASSAQSPFYVGPNAVKDSYGIKIVTPSGWGKLRPLFDSKMGSEKSVHFETSVVLLCLQDEFGSDEKRLSHIVFALCVYVKLLRSRVFTHDTIRLLKELSSLIQTEYETEGLQSAFTYKMHVSIN